MGIRDDIATIDQEAGDWEDLGEDYSVKEYENHEDFILAYADVTETWVRAALEVLPAEQIEAVDRHVAAARPLAPSQGGTPQRMAPAPTMGDDNPMSIHEHDDRL